MSYLSRILPTLPEYATYVEARATLAQRRSEWRATRNNSSASLSYSIAAHICRATKDELRDALRREYRSAHNLHCIGLGLAIGSMLPYVVEYRNPALFTDLKARIYATSETHARELIGACLTESTITRAYIADQAVR